MKAPRIGLLIALAAFAPLALAMPDGGASIIAYLASISWQTYTAIAVSIAYSAYSAEEAKRRATHAANDALQDRVMTVRGATEPRRMVLGRQRVGGVVAFVGSTGANKEHYVMVIALAGHECDAIEDIYFDGNKVDFSGEYVSTPPFARTDLSSANDVFSGDGAQVTFTLSSTPVAGTVAAVQTSAISVDNYQSLDFPVNSISGKSVTLDGPPIGGFTITYQTSAATYFARVRRFLGGPGQTVDAVVQSLFPGAWDAAHPMSGCAGLAIFFDYNEDAFQTSVDVSAVMRGAKVYDPRKDSTAGGAGAHRVTDSTTWEWSENPALLIGYAAMSPLCGRQPPASVRWVDVAAAANICDTPVDYATWGVMADDDGALLTDDDDTLLLV